jgi:hypothetical protein
MLPPLRLLLLVCLVVSSAAGDSFLNADTDHDGKIDRKEFEEVRKKVITAVSGVIEETEDLPAQVYPKSASLSESLDKMPGFWSAFVNSLVMIWATELGDKTFFIAAILAMRHER